MGGVETRKGCEGGFDFDNSLYGQEKVKVVLNEMMHWPGLKLWSVPLLWVIVLEATTFTFKDFDTLTAPSELSLGMET